MPDIAFLNDTPITLADPSADGTIRSRIQVAELGSFTDPRYGRFAITSQMVDSWRKVLASHFCGTVAIDYDHATDKGGSTEAAGWVTSLDVDGAKVFADVEWTPAGAQAVKDKRWRFISPTFVDGLKDQSGKNLGAALLRVALTNNPFLRGMAAVTLSAASGPVFAERDEDPADSRPSMPEFNPTKLAAALGVDADETKLLAAVADLKAAAEKPTTVPDLKVLAAADPSVVLLSKDEHDKLKSESESAGALAARVTSLEADAVEQKFTLAYEAAFDAGQVDAKPETRELHKSIYDAAPEAALKNLAALPKIVNTTARGTGGSSGAEAPEGTDPESFELNKRVEAYMAEHKITNYVTALSAVTALEA